MMRTVLLRLAADTRYALLSFPLAIVGFVLVVTGLSLGAGLLVTVVGIPVAAVTLRAARGIAVTDRAWMANVLKNPPAPPRYYTAPADAGGWSRLIAPLRCTQSWLDVLGSLLRLPVATAAFAVTVAWWSLAAGGLLFPVYGPIVAGIRGNTTLAELIGLGAGLTPAVALNVTIGAVAALTLPLVVRGAALVVAGVGQGPVAVGALPLAYGADATTDTDTSAAGEAMGVDVSADPVPPGSSESTVAVRGR